MVKGKTWRWIKNSFAAAVVTLGAFLAPGPAANPAALAATIYVVNDGGADCGSFASTSVDIQTAVTAAINGGVKTILVCPGSYSDFDVVGANTLTIKAALPGTFPTINAPATANGEIILVQDSSGVVLDGLKIDGSNFNDALTGFTRGVYFHNASGTVQNSSITRIRCFPDGCASGYGIGVVDDDTNGKISTVVVKNTSLTDIDAEGIRADGPVKLTVSGMGLIGNVSGGAGYPPNGVNFNGGGSTGMVTNSMLSGVIFGVYLQSSSKVTVSGNTIDHADTGVYIEAFCNPGAEMASSNKITGNSFSAIATDGIYIYSGGPGCTHADNQTISNNRFMGIGGSSSAVNLDIAAGASGDKIRITGNTIFGFGNEILVGLGATHLTNSKNTWIP